MGLGELRSANAFVGIAARTGFHVECGSGVRVFIPMVCAEKLYYRWVEQKKEVFFHRIELFWSLKHVDLLFLCTQKYQNTLFPTFFVLFFQKKDYPPPVCCL